MVTRMLSAHSSRFIRALGPNIRTFLQNSSYGANEGLLTRELGGRA